MVSGIYERPRSWHAAVADYQVLYSTATLASVPGGSENLRGEVAAVGAKLGLPIELESLEIAGLALKRAQLLAFEGRPLAQFAYRDAAGIPVALCAMRTGDADSALQTATLRGLAAASWSRNGFGFIVIGAMPPDAVRRAATELVGRI
jgi:anti-sigma factor RsiW